MSTVLHAGGLHVDGQKTTTFNTKLIGMCIFVWNSFQIFLRTTKPSRCRRVGRRIELFDGGRKKIEKRPSRFPFRRTSRTSCACVLCVLLCILQSANGGTQRRKTPLFANRKTNVYVGDSVIVLNSTGRFCHVTI